MRPHWANYACPSANDTSSLWPHFKKCKKNPEKVLDKKQQLLSFKKEKGGASNLLAVTFNKVRCRNVLAKFVVKDEQAFKVVEGEGFKELIQELQPMFVVPSRVTIVRDVHHLYFKERAKLMEVLTTTGQRVCLQVIAGHLVPLLSLMARSMKRKYDKYWGNPEDINPLLFIAVVLDPRYKMKYLKYCFESIYNAELVATIVMKVESLLQRIYVAYVGDGEASKAHQSQKTPDVCNETDKRRLLEGYLHQQKMDTTEKKNDVDRYLTDEPLNPITSSFDILIWWKENSERYKILSMIARDVLAIQVSTVASESTFSTSGRVLDPFRSSLSPKMVEALVCTQSWLKGQQGGLKLDNYINEMHAYEFLEEDNPEKNKMKDHAEKSKAKKSSIIDVDE